MERKNVINTIQMNSAGVNKGQSERAKDHIFLNNYHFLRLTFIYVSQILARDQFQMYPGTHHCLD